MKPIAIAAAALAALVVAPPALAQDPGALTGLVSTVGEGLGQSLGQSIVGGQSVFVYASGRAKLPAPPPGAYSIQIAASAPTAVEAAAQRDAELAKLRAVAAQFGASTGLTADTLSLGDAGAGGFHLPFMPAPSPNAPPAGADGSPAKPSFDAKATLLLGEPANGKAAEFLDALHAAGADNIASGDTESAFSRLTSSYLGGARPDRVDAKIWDAATRDAIKNARDQAATLAAAAGRQVGEARQILFLARALDGDDATVTVAVRFGFADGKP